LFASSEAHEVPLSSLLHDHKGWQHHSQLKRPSRQPLASLQDSGPYTDESSYSRLLSGHKTVAGAIMAADGGLQMPDLQYKMSKKISQLQKVRNNMIFCMPNDAARAALI
jgi:hypothetical protein